MCVCLFAYLCLSRCEEGERWKRRKGRVRKPVLSRHGPNLLQLCDLRHNSQPLWPQCLQLYNEDNGVYPMGLLWWLNERLSVKLIGGYLVQFNSVPSLSRVQLFETPWIAAHQASLSITNSRSLLKLMPIESVVPSSHLILCSPLLLLPPIPPSIRVFSNESTLCMRWPKYWSCSLSISPSNEHPGLISFRMDWLDLLTVQGTLQSLLQHHSSKASILQHSAFFTVQLSHPYMTTGKTIAVTR